MELFLIHRAVNDDGQPPCYILLPGPISITNILDAGENYWMVTESNSATRGNTKMRKCEMRKRESCDD